MAIYRNVQLTFWTDTKVVDEFTPEDKYFFLYLLTNPHTNLCGCYELPMRTAEMETGYARDTIINLIDRMEQLHKVIRYDPDTKEVMILNWKKYNWTGSEQYIRGLEVEIEQIKSEKFKKSLKTSLFGECHQRVTRGSGEGMQTVTSSNSNSNSNSNSKKKGRFAPPTVEEVRAYCLERGNRVDPEAFVAFYESKGWKVGNQTMKNWKAAVITWEKRRRDDEPKMEIPTREEVADRCIRMGYNVDIDKFMDDLKAGKIQGDWRDETRRRRNDV